MKDANEILHKAVAELGSVDVEQLPQVLEKFKAEVSQMEKDLK